jgi:putative addiction module component (TIGR02574 family)
MSAIDYRQMTTAEKLDLIGEIWDSIDQETIVLADEQATELDRRLATLDEDIKDGRDAAKVSAELRHRYL